jgi:putative FmdB family regulatory protein
MPLYRFLCPSCGQGFELFLRPSEVGMEVKCPHCQAETKDGSPAQAEADPDGTGGCGPNKVT